MADAENPKDCQIVLEKVPYDKQPEAALFLSGCFSLPPASTRGIANSGPIALISDITKVQAEAVIDELSASLPSGVELRVADAGESSKLSRLQWPRPPRIYGRDLSEFASGRESHDALCPHCGKPIRVAVAGDGVTASPVAESVRRKLTTRRFPAASDKDPLFSGIKPLASADSNYASLQSLQAGDTGFWMDYSDHSPPPRPPPRPESIRGKSGAETTDYAKKSTGRITAGLSAFMKPGAFALVVGRTKDNQAIKMISEIMGIDEDEARERCMNLGLCVAKNISLDEAQNLLARFRNLGARARIVKPM